MRFLKFSLLLYSILSLSSELFAYNSIGGKITDEDGQVLPFATVFVKDTGFGTTSNYDGYYEISLNPGTYTIIFQYMGYKSESLIIELGMENIELNIKLQPQSFVLPNLTYRSGKEDPAYGIMRKVIAKSKYHLYQLQHYTTTIYMKGSGRLKKIPFMFRNRLEKEGIDTAKVFMVESVTELEFELPNTYRENVISINSTMEEETLSPMTYIKASFYEEKIADALSPLSPGAFAHYKYRYDGAFNDNGYTVFKIYVEPRIKGDRVFEGYLYILEDLWAIHSIDFDTRFQGFEVHISQIYQPVTPIVWMPVSAKFIVSGSFMGFGLAFNYVAVNNNYQVTMNPDLTHDSIPIDVETEIINNSPERQTDLAISELPLDRELSKKEMKKMMRSYEKEALQSENVGQKKDIIINEYVSVDSMANKQDTTYWSQIRPIPLTPLESKSYLEKDSLILIQNEKKAEDSIKNEKNKKFRIDHIISGNTYALSEKTSLEWRSIWDKSSYNTVEGFNFNAGFDFRFKLDSTQRISIGPTLRYGISSKQFYGLLDAKYSFRKHLKRGEFSVSGGRYIRQINENNPIPFWLNMVSSLFAEQNFMKLYEKDFAKLFFKIPASPNLDLFITSEWAEKRALQNNSDYSIIKYDREFTPNNPQNSVIGDTEFNPYQMATAGINIEYAPFQRYMIRNEVKSIIRNSSPVFSVGYRVGISLDDQFDNYHFLSSGVRYGSNFGVGNRYDFAINVGGFLNGNDFPFPEFAHFMGNRTILLTNDIITSFRMLDYYYYSTNDYYIDAHLNYQFRKLLITQIIYTRFMGWREDLFINYLYTNSVKNYYELGYGIDNIFNFLRLELISQFVDTEYKGLGFTIGISKIISLE